MPKEIISTDAAPAPFGGAPYNQATRARDLVFLAGQLGLDPVTGALVDGGIAAQTEQVFRNIAAILEADPRQASIHPWDAQAPDEEIMLLEHTFMSHVPEAFVNIPSYRAWLNEQDWTPAYQYLRILLQSLQWQKRQRGNVRERWVLKTPNHLGYIDTLFEVFPGASAILTHRDPIDTVPSAASMNNAMWSLYSDEKEADQAGQQWMERLAWGTKRAMAARERYPAERFVDIDFRDAMKDPIAEIERAYGVFGIEMTDAAREGMEQWRRDNPRDKRPKHEYSLAEYGLTEAGILDAFSGYRARFIETAG